MGEPISTDRSVSENSHSATHDALSVLARGLAHDVNNLMSIVLGNATLVRNRLGPGHQCLPTLQAIEEAAQRAGLLTRELMSFARADTRLTEAVNLNAIVYHVLAEDEHRLAPVVRIERYIDPDLWKVAGNQRLVAQIVIALAENALDAIGEGKGVLTLRTSNTELNEVSTPKGTTLRPGRYVFLSVEDTGGGISPEALEKIFNPGYTTKSAKHSIGLSGVQKLLETMGGWIGITSTVGRGTAVQVFFPVAEMQAEKPRIRSLDLPGGNETIMIVDDERPIVEVCGEILRRLGYTVVTAGNGKEAIELCQNHPGEIHAALLDIIMPVMGGAEAYPMLRRIRPNMKIVICTGFEQEDISHVLRDAGTSCLLKPFLPSALAHELRGALDGRKSQ